VASVGVAVGDTAKKYNRRLRRNSSYAKEQAQASTEHQQLAKFPNAAYYVSVLAA
jgi:hypothetical protein